MDGAIRIPLGGIFIITIAMLAICMPASRLIVRRRSPERFCR
jgi:hypothetical protein